MMKKAIINKTSKKVVNIIECDEEGIKGFHFPLDCEMWDCSRYDVMLGDSFADGVFYREATPLPYIPTTEEELSRLKADSTAFENQILLSENEIDARLCELELR